MSNSIATLNNVQTMSSLEIAVLTGKTLGNIHVDIRKMIDALKDDRDFNHQQYQELKDNRGYTSEFLLDKELTTILVSGYSAIMRAHIVRRWQFLESQIPKFSLPPQLIRYMKHVDAVPKRHFCAMGIIYNEFISKFALVGHDMLEDMMPDGSFSRMFSDTLRADDIDPQTFPTYPFVSSQGFHGNARAYPMKYYDRADEYLQFFWLPIHAIEYLKPRDRGALQKMPAALPYLVEEPKVPRCKQQMTLF